MSAPCLLMLYDNVLYHTFTFYSVKKNNDLYESVPIIVDTDYQVSYTSYTYNMYDGGVMVSLRLGKKLENRLEQLAEGTGRTKTYYIRLLLEEHLDELEDRYIAEQRLETPGPRLSSDEMRQELGLDH